MIIFHADPLLKFLSIPKTGRVSWSHRIDAYVYQNACIKLINKLFYFSSNWSKWTTKTLKQSTKNILGDQKNFRKNFHFQDKNLWWPFFKVIDLVHRIFPFFSYIFRMFTMLNVVYDHFLTRKSQFFTLFILSRTSYNTTSQNIGGDQCMGRPPPPKSKTPSMTDNWYLS